jgi:hypothetical protein
MNRREWLSHCVVTLGASGLTPAVQAAGVEADLDDDDLMKVWRKVFKARQARELARQRVRLSQKRKPSVERLCRLNRRGYMEVIERSSFFGDIDGCCVWTVIK